LREIIKRAHDDESGIDRDSFVVGNANIENGSTENPMRAAIAAVVPAARRFRQAAHIDR